MLYRPRRYSSPDVPRKRPFASSWMLPNYHRTLQRLAACESAINTVPVCHFILTQPPAEVDILIVHARREIYNPVLDVLEMDADTLEIAQALGNVIAQTCQVVLRRKHICVLAV